MEDDYERQWDNWRLIQFGFWGLFLGWIPAIAIAHYLLGEFFAKVVMGIWVVAWIMILWLKFDWRCPRCGKRFHSNWWLHNIPVRKCLHCKLPKYAKTGSDSGRGFLD
jgi:hypothetical protein